MAQKPPTASEVFANLSETNFTSFSQNKKEATEGLRFSQECVHCVFPTAGILLGEEWPLRCSLPVIAVSLHALDTSLIIGGDRGDCREKEKVESIRAK